METKLKAKVNGTVRFFYRYPPAAMGLYFVLYDIAFCALESWRRPVHLVHCRLDDLIPFCRFAVIPYVMWFGWVPLMLIMLMLKSRGLFWRTFGGLAVGTSFTLALYAVYPTGLRLRQSVSGVDFCAQLVRLIYRTDTPTNVCPSLHVFVTVVILLALFNADWTSVRFRRVNGLLGLAICCSTVLLDQHSLIDVVLGIILALWVFAVFCRIPAPSVQDWMQPRQRALRSGEERGW